MSQAVIGNLRATLGLDSAEFDAGAKKAQRTLSGLKSSLVGFAAGVTSALSLSAIGAVVKSSIDHMDELGKAAQKIGIPVEELSKLEYAAQLADVGLGELTSNVGRFSKAIAEVAGGGKNDAGAALKALGISAVTAQGQLRPTTDILADVAAKFAGLQDGAGKTALAMALFGKSGADMIPFLNGGREAIAGAAAEAQQFGIVVSGPAAQAAEEFNDNLTRLQSAGQGMVQVVAAELLPILADLSGQMVDAAKSADTMAMASDAAKMVLIELVRFAIEAKQTIFELSTYWDVLSQNWQNSDGPTAAIDRWRKAFDDIGAKADETKQKIDALTGADDPTGSLKSIQQWTEQKSAPGKGDLQKPVLDVAPLMIPEAKKGIDETQKALDKLKAAGKSVWEETRTPAENYRLEIERLNKMLQAGYINQDTYNRAVANLRDSQPGATGAVERYQQRVRELNDLLAAGAISQLDYNRALHEAQAEFDNAGSAAKSALEDTTKAAADLAKSVNDELASTFESWIDKAIDGTFDLKDALADLAKDVAKMFIHSGLQGLFGGGGGGFLGTLLGGLFGGFTGFYADGGKIPSNKWGVVNDGLPEIVSGPATVTPMKDLMGGESSGNQTVNVVLHPSKELWAEVDQRDRQTEGRAVRVSVSESARQADRNFASTYQQKQVRKF